MIRAVFRVQCDGPCQGWLSEIGQVVAAYGSDTARVVGLYSGERAARVAAQGAGWEQMSARSNGLWRCPTCAANPLDTPPMMSDLDVCATGTHMVTEPGGTCACQSVRCVCTHPRSDHNINDLCVALPGVLGCGCMGWSEART